MICKIARFVFSPSTIASEIARYRSETRAAGLPGAARAGTERSIRKAHCRDCNYRRCVLRPKKEGKFNLPILGRHSFRVRVTAWKEADMSERLNTGNIRLTGSRMPTGGPRSISHPLISLD